MLTLEQCIMPKQAELFDLLLTIYKDKADYLQGGYILVPGDAPIMLIAHLDTVHKEAVKHICKTEDGRIIMSPEGIGGDDRCGVYALNTIYERAEVKPWLLFTCDEEVGGIGALDFTKDYNRELLPKELAGLKMLVEIDRRGDNDAVYYDCDNVEFEDYITSKGFETDWGSFSDISTIAPVLGVAAVNLSSGYYNAHTQYEYIDSNHLDATIERVLEIVEDCTHPDFPAYKYIKAKRTYSYGGAYYGKDYSLNKYGWKSGWYDYCYEDEEDEYLADVPESIRNEYDALLDYHSEEELNDILDEFGEHYIELLFESEFGGTYEEIFGVADEEDATESK